MVRRMIKLRKVMAERRGTGLHTGTSKAAEKPLIRWF